MPVDEGKKLKIENRITQTHNVVVLRNVCSLNWRMENSQHILSTFYYFMKRTQEFLSRTSYAVF